MKKSFITLTALLIVGFMTTSAFAWGHGYGRGGSCDGQCRAIYNSLTGDQKTQLRELHQQWVDETYKTRSDMMAKHQELRMLMETSKPAKSKIQDLSGDILELKKSLADKRIDFVLKAKKIAPELNPMDFGPKCGMGGCSGFSKRIGQGGPCPSGSSGQQVTQ